MVFKHKYNMEKIPIGYNEIMLFITSIIMHSLFKFLIRYINNISAQLTNNLNELSRILNTKIRYVDFEKENKGLDNKSYIKKLHDWVFSFDDLKEIGVDDVFLNQNKEKLLPRKVVEKYTSFRNELENYKLENESKAIKQGFWNTKKVCCLS